MHVCSRHTWTHSNRRLWRRFVELYSGQFERYKTVRIKRFTFCNPWPRFIVTILVFLHCECILVLVYTQYVNKHWHRLLCNFSKLLYKIAIDSCAIIHTSLLLHIVCVSVSVCVCAVNVLNKSFGYMIADRNKLHGSLPESRVYILFRSSSPLWKNLFLRFSFSSFPTMIPHITIWHFHRLIIKFSIRLVFTTHSTFALNVIYL